MADEPEIVLVRHGETEWSSSGRHTSYSDIPLTDRGREEAAALAARLMGRGFRLVLSSPRERALDTCAFAGLGDRVEICDDLSEWNYGDYEGRTSLDIREEVPDWTIFTHGAPGGETIEDVAGRADQVIARAAEAGGDVACFSHGHFLRVLGARWIGLDGIEGRLLGLDVATISVLGYERTQRVLRSWNT
jgi:broad specificity phosphatase PhoE